MRTTKFEDDWMQAALQKGFPEIKDLQTRKNSVLFLVGISDKF